MFSRSNNSKPVEVKYIVIVYDTEQNKFSSLSQLALNTAINGLPAWKRLLPIGSLIKAVLRDGMEIIERVHHQTTFVGEEATKHFLMVWGHNFNLKRRFGRSDFLPGQHLTATFGEENGTIIRAMLEEHFPHLKENVP